MSLQLKKEDHQRVARFLKKKSITHDRPLKSVLSQVVDGSKGAILAEEQFVTKQKQSISTYAQAIALHQKKGLIQDVVVSEKATQRELYEVIVSCIRFLNNKGMTSIELVSNKRLEPLFKKMSFVRIGEREQDVFMRYASPKEVQSNLQKTFQDTELLEKVSSATAERLRKLH